MQIFINLYPQSTHLQECNQIIDKLRLKLENKAFDISKLYYNTTNYQAAIVAFQNFQKDFPVVINILNSCIFIFIDN